MAPNYKKCQTYCRFCKGYVNSWSRTASHITEAIWVSNSISWQLQAFFYNSAWPWTPIYKCVRCVCVCTSVWPVHTGAPLLLSLSALSQPSLYFCRMSPTALKCLFLSLPTQPIFFLSPFHPPTPSLSFSLTSGSRPQNGSMILYNRKKVKYRKDGYCWKKRKDGKTTREDHMKLKVQGVEVRPFVRAVKHRP